MPSDPHGGDIDRELIREVVEITEKRKADPHGAEERLRAYLDAGVDEPHFYSDSNAPNLLDEDIETVLRTLQQERERADTFRDEVVVDGLPWVKVRCTSCREEYLQPGVLSTMRCWDCRIKEQKARAESAERDARVLRYWKREGLDHVLAELEQWGAYKNKSIDWHQGVANAIAEVRRQIAEARQEEA